MPLIEIVCSVYQIGIYLNPTAACHTKASNKKKRGIKGRTSTRGLNREYASGSLAKISAASIFLYRFQ
jgi:hypothetical protein